MSTHALKIVLAAAFILHTATCLAQDLWTSERRARCPFHKSLASFLVWTQSEVEGMLIRRLVTVFPGPGRRAIMPMPFAQPVTLPMDERERLEALARAHATPQALAFRCRLILRAAAPDAPPNLRVAADMHCHRQTVCLWRTRYLAHGLAGLQDASSSGRPRRFYPL